MAGFLVSASTGAMSSLLQKLGVMLSDEYKLLKDVRGDIEFLKAELEAMQTFLLEMADVEEPSKQAKLRVDAVREMSYEVEDNIDKFMILVGHETSSKSDGFMKFFDKSMKKITDIKTRHNIAKDVKNIKSKVKEVSERYARYKIDESSRPRNEKVDPRLCAIYKDASELVGVDGPRDKLVNWLSNEGGEWAHRPKVISIVGYGGLGKTTLAKQVFDKLGAKYECRAFVSISRSPDMTQILSSILSQLRKQNCADSVSRDPQLSKFHNQNYVDAGTRDLHLIIDQIREFLEEKRYFIIIDDIWDVQAWRPLDCALFKNDCGSVIMTTTRIHDVAKSCCSSQWDLVYKIQPLNVPDSKRLFFKRIFGCEEKCPPNLKEASEDILKRCEGLPLAIIAISSLLVTGTKEEWDRVRSSIEFAQGKNPDIDTMHYILSLSYFHLPLHLRTCLLYLTMFPEDAYIWRLPLVERWIYEGIIHGKDGEDLAKLGETYFHELVNRSLIQPVNIQYDGTAWGCRVHDTVLDFLISKSNEENFCTLLSKPLKPGSRVRRLSLMGNEDQGSVEQLDLSHARSLIGFENTKHFPSLVKSNALRVLDIRCCRGLGNHHVKDIGKLFQLRYLNISSTGISELPREIGELFQLRYLNISSTGISELPREIGNLDYLEVLRASSTYLVELPESITRVQRLAQLSVPAETKFPDGMGNMKNLQELGDINPLKQSLNFVEELGKLTNLRELYIVWDTRESSCKASLKGKYELLSSSLRKLETFNLATTKIEFRLTEDDAGLIRHAFFPALNSIRVIIGIRIRQLRWISKWLVSLVNLEILSTNILEEIEQHEIEMVGSIPTLLKFKDWSGSPGPIIISGGFQRLRELFFYVSNELMFEAGAMPNLKKLDLRINLHKLISARGGAAGGFDFGIQHLSSLAVLRVYIECNGVRAAEVEAAEGAFKSMADAHPNLPILDMARQDQEKMLRNE